MLSYMYICTWMLLAMALNENPQRFCIVCMLRLVYNCSKASIFIYPHMHLTIAYTVAPRRRRQLFLVITRRTLRSIAGQVVARIYFLTYEKYSQHQHVRHKKWHNCGVYLGWNKVKKQYFSSRQKQCGYYARIEHLQLQNAGQLHTHTHIHTQ